MHIYLLKKFIDTNVIIKCSKIEISLSYFRTSMIYYFLLSIFEYFQEPNISKFGLNSLCKANYL